MRRAAAAARSRSRRSSAARGSSRIKASSRCTATRASRCRRSRRCSSTTCCSPSSSTRGSSSPPTTSVAAGLLLQRLPPPGAGVDETRIGRDEDFNRVATLGATLTREELLRLDADTVLRRLFWEEKLTRFAPLVGAAAPRFACTCSRAKVGAMLRGLGRAEIDDIVREQSQVEVGCEFCGLRYRFDPVDVGELFVAPADQAPGSNAIN